MKVQRSNVLASDSSYLDKQSGYRWDMMFFPIAHNSPHSFQYRLAPSLLWRLEVPVLQSYHQVLGLPACLLLLRVNRLAHNKRFAHGNVLLLWWGSARKWFSDFGFTQSYRSVPWTLKPLWRTAKDAFVICSAKKVVAVQSRLCILYKPYPPKSIHCHFERIIFGKNRLKFRFSIYTLLQNGGQ